jgi:hypothetical protein
VRQRGTVQATFGEIEKCRIVVDFLRLTVDNFIHPHRFAKHLAAVKKLYAKMARLVEPKRMFRPEANRLITVIVEIEQRFG